MRTLKYYCYELVFIFHILLSYGLPIFFSSPHVRSDAATSSMDFPSKCPMHIRSVLAHVNIIHYITLFCAYPPQTFFANVFQIYTMHTYIHVYWTTDCNRFIKTIKKFLGMPLSALPPPFQNVWSLEYSSWYLINIIFVYAFVCWRNHPFAVCQCLYIRTEFDVN